MLGDEEKREYTNLGDTIINRYKCDEVVIQ